MNPPNALFQSERVKSSTIKSQGLSNQEQFTYSILSFFVVLLFLIIFLSMPARTVGQAQSVTINFDNLPAGALVINQYQPKVIFSATGFGGGSGGPLGFDLYTDWLPAFSGNLAIYSDYNGNHNNPFYSHGFGPVFLVFPVPVRNFSFNILNYFQSSGFPINWIDVYVNHNYYGTYYAYGSLGQGTVPVTMLTGINGITEIKIYNPRNYNQFNIWKPLYYDDFTFKPNFDVNITNARVTGYLNQTTQTALVGADVALNASLTGSIVSGGLYTWTFTGPYTIVGGSANSSTVTIRSTAVGTITANVSYTVNTLTASSKVTINEVLPTLTSFSAQVDPEQVTRDSHCGVPPSIFGARYHLGCLQVNRAPDGTISYGPDAGIKFTTSAQIPSGQYLSDLAQSGIKIKQFASTLRKRVDDTHNGNFVCDTVRSAEAAFDTGWQLDGYEAMTYFAHPPPTFGQSNVLTYNAYDSPGLPLDTTDPQFPQLFSMNDVVLSDDRFQAYVYYFVGDPLAPRFQVPLKLSSETRQYSYIGWRFSGQASFVYDPLNRFVKYQLQPMGTPSVSLSGTDSLPALHGNAQDNPDTICPGDTTAPSTNMIDGARCFVIQQYWDFLGRTPDQDGLDFWTYQMARCLFDRNCIYGSRNPGAYHGTRTAVAYDGFFKAAPFNQSDPAMANPPGSPGFDPSVYNPAFVRYCYLSFLRRAPDPGGYSYWIINLNSFGDYLGVIDSFVTGPEYRNRGPNGTNTFHSCN